MVYQHYLDVSSGNPYNNTQLFTGPIPMPSNTSPFGYDPMEFAAGYPNVPERPLQLFNKYPLPRYPVNDSMHRNLPWNADINPFTSDPVSILYSSEASVIHKQLALDWNHMLFGGVANRHLGDLRFKNDTLETHPLHYIIDQFKDNSLSGLPRFLISSWGHAVPSLVNPTYEDTAYVIFQNYFVNNNFYIRDINGIPEQLIYSFGRKMPNLSMANPLFINDYRLALMERDGEFMEKSIDTLMEQILPPNLRFITMLGENDETYHYVDSTKLQPDSAILADRNTGGFTTWLNYQGVRLNTIRHHYRDATIAYLDSVNMAAGRPDVQDIWYQTAGSDKRYPWLRNILRFNDGHQRACMDFYPLEPARWRHGVAHMAGFDNAVVSCKAQIALGEKLFIPAVAPGIHDGGASFVTTDIAMLRPGQYLGALKAMGVMGADAYNSFSLWFPVNTDPSNWRTWWMPMAGYAQAAMTRAKPFLYNGHVLEGDISYITSLSVSGTATTYYTFSTGNVNDLVVCRQLSGQNQYLITASAQRLCNAPGVTPRVKDIAFTLKDTAGIVVFSPLQVEERLQGSTYILDLTTPSSPVMTQLDRWHEWKEPSRWCRDFDFEAEVWDSITGTVTTATERPAGSAAGDFREFTTFVNVASPSDILGYRFRPRGADQDSLHFWARVRNNSGSAQTLTVNLDNNTSISVPVPVNPNWQWVGSTSFFHVVDTTWHWLFVKPSSDSLDFDLVTLKRSPDDFAADTFKVSANANTVCLGDTTHFRADVLLPAGCIDFHWDFGDGRSSYETDPVYVYPYPGTYEVVFTAWHACLDSTVADTIQVLVVAPMVDAGPPGMHCLGMQDTLQGLVNAGTTFSWVADPALSSTNVLDPVVQAVGSHFFYLRGDTVIILNGNATTCSMTDSAWVAVTPALTPLPMPDDTVCRGTMLPLWVDSVHTVWWDSVPGILYGPGCSPCFLANATQVLTWHATDACECGTVSGQVTVTVPGLVPRADTVCHGDTLSLFAYGDLDSHYLWSPTGDTTQSIVVAPLSDTDYIVQSDSAFGCYNISDTITVRVDSSILNMALLTPPGTLCLGDSQQLLAAGGLTYAWSGGLDSVANPWAYPTSTTTYSVTVSGLACVMTDSVEIVVDTVPAGMLTADTNRVCRGDTVFLAASGGTSYLWNDGSTLPVREEIPLSTGWWAVTVSDGGFCTWTDSVLVTVDSNCCFIPGAVVLQDTVLASAAGLASLTGGDYHVMDMLVVDVAASFSGVTFHMAPGAVIDVLPGVTVVSNGCTYTAACGDSLWGRVRLAGTGTSWIANGDLYEHAREALLVEADAIANVSGSDFIACERGVRVKPVVNTQSPITLKTNRFLGGPMLPPLQTASLGVAGVQADGVAVIDISGNNFFSGWQSGALVSACGEAFSSSNTFSNCRAGINVQNTTRMRVGSPGAGRSNTFSSCTDGVVTKGSATWVVDNRFDRCTVGFRGLGPGVNAATTVSGSLHALGTALADSANIYLDCWRGVSTDGKQRVVVRGDSILRSENAGVFTRFNDGGSMTVERNVLVDNTVGVFAGTSSGMAGMVKWNTIRGGNQANRTGIQCGVLTNPALGNPPGVFDMRIHDNDIRLQGNGVWVESSERVDVWNNFVVVRPNTAQPAGSLHAGINVLSSNDIRVAQNTVSSDIDGAKNLGTRGIYVFSSPMTNARCNQVRSTGRCFVWEGISQPSDFLGNTMQQGKEGVVFLNTGLIGQQGAYQPSQSIAYASDNKWMGSNWSSHTNSILTQSILTNRLFVRPTGVFFPAINLPIFISPQASPINAIQIPNGTPSQIDCQSFILQTDKGTGIKDAANAQRMQGGAFEEATQWRREVWVHKELLKDPNMLASDTTFQSWFGQMQGTDVDKASRAELAMEMRDSSAAQANASAIAGTGLPPSLEKSIMEARLRGIPLDSISIFQLRTLASICMGEGGPAVNRARAVLAAEGEFIYDNPDCPSNTREIFSIDHDILNTNQVRCWPNPTNGSLTFEFGEEAGTEAQVILYDIQGRMILTGKVRSNLPIILPDQASGLISVQLIKPTGEVYAWKVEVVR